jgi:hypothetical protein
MEVGVGSLFQFRLFVLVVVAGGVAFNGYLPKAFGGDKGYSGIRGGEG